MWCDDVLMPFVESQVTKKSANDSKKIETTAWIGIGSRNQVKFDLIIHFGKYSVRRYAKGKKMDDCIPDFEDENKIFFSLENRRMEILLK